MSNALGMIETWGVVANLEATDAMSKSADVEMIGYENIGSGFVTHHGSGGCRRRTGGRGCRCGSRETGGRVCHLGGDPASPRLRQKDHGFA